MPQVSHFIQLSYEKCQFAKADLRGAEIAKDKNCAKVYAVWQASPLESRGYTLRGDALNDMLTVFRTDAGLFVQAGYFGPWPIKDFWPAVAKDRRNNRHSHAYRAANKCACAVLGEADNLTPELDNPTESPADHFDLNR